MLSRAAEKVKFRFGQNVDIPDMSERNDEIVGMIGVQEVRDDVAEVRRLRVDGAQRRRGIGTALMEQALTFCRDHSYVKIVLDVRIERSPAIEMLDERRRST